MSDLIDRQAAIDAILEMNIENRVSWLDCVLDTLDALPSAHQEIIRCKECKYASMTYSGECKYCVKWNEEYDDSTKLYLDSDFYCGFAERRTDG